MTNLRLIRKFVQNIHSNKESEHSHSIQFKNCLGFYFKNKDKIYALLYSDPSSSGFVTILGYQGGNLYINDIPYTIDLKDFLDPKFDDIYLILKYGPEIKDDNLIEVTNKSEVRNKSYNDCELPPLDTTHLDSYLEVK